MDDFSVFYYLTGNVVKRTYRNSINTTLVSWWTGNLSEAVTQVLYLWQGYDQDAAAFLSAGETQVAVSGVESPGCMAAWMWRPQRTRGHLMELFSTREPKQSQDVLSYCLFLQDPGKETMRGRVSQRWNTFRLGGRNLLIQTLTLNLS